VAARRANWLGRHGENGLMWPPQGLGLLWMLERRFAWRWQQWRPFSAGEAQDRA